MAKEGEKYTAMAVTCVRVRAQEEEDERAARSVGQKGQGGNAAQRKKKERKRCYGGLVRVCCLGRPAQLVCFIFG
jgi:hypothetical protein